MRFTAIEKAILDLADGGMSSRQIEKQGFKPSRVRYVLSTFGTKAQDDAAMARHGRDMAIFSKALLSAINRARAA